MEAKQVPLYEQLENVPLDARLVIEDSDGMGATILAIGRMCHGAAAALRAAIKQAQPDQANQQKTFMSITDDYGKPLRPQYRVIEKRGKWVLLYDQHQSGEVVRHEFRIQKLQHDIALYPGIALAEAQKRFCEKVESDHE